MFRVLGKNTILSLRRIDYRGMVSSSNPVHSLKTIFEQEKIPVKCEEPEI